VARKLISKSPIVNHKSEFSLLKSQICQSSDDAMEPSPSANSPDYSISSVIPWHDNPLWAVDDQVATSTPSQRMFLTNEN